jgi:transposase InsO family protein
MPASEAFAQLRLRFIDPIQHDYEVIRPIVLFAQPVTERSRETEVERTTVGEKARRFVTGGMLGLVDRRTSEAGRKGHAYPELVAQYILYLKQLYPPIHYREIARILERKFGYQTNHHTLKHFLEQHPIPVQLGLKLETFHQFDDAYQARWTVVRLFYEGWDKKSIAGLLHLSRKHVTHLIAAFEQDGFAALEDARTRPPAHPANQLTLPFLKEVLAIQQDYPRAGRFRVRGLLEQKLGEQVPSERSVGRAMAINRFFLGAPGPWPPPARSAQARRPLPYQPLFRHQYWFIDIRYLVKLEGHWVYSLCIIEGYSRKILAGMASDYQDELAVLQLLHAALAAYGCPEGIVSDHGSVFTAGAYRQLLHALQIEACTIEKRQAWQNLIEAQFKIQLRLADAQFEQASSREEIQAQHAAFIHLFNTTAHWAHRERTDGCTTPEAVLGGENGRPLAPDTLRRVFRHLQFPRTVNRHGCVSVQRFYLYAEPGLAKRRVSVWIYADRLHIEYQQHLLARYTCTVDRGLRALSTVSHPTLSHTPFASPQLEFFELDDEQWLKIRRRPPYAPRKPQMPLARQFVLGLEFMLWLWLL